MCRYCGFCQFQQRLWDLKSSPILVWIRYLSLTSIKVFLKANEINFAYGRGKQSYFGMIWFRAKWWCVTDQHTPTNHHQQFTFHFTWCCGSQFHPAFLSKLSLTLQKSATANRVANVGNKLSANDIDVKLTFKRLRIFWDTRPINFKNEMNRRCIVYTNISAITVLIQFVRRFLCRYQLNSTVILP